MVISLGLNQRKSDTPSKPASLICKNSVKQKELRSLFYFSLVFVILWAFLSRMENETKFPSIKAVRSALVSEYNYLRKGFSADELSDPYEKDSTPGTDCRLRVHGSNWQILIGSSDYDQDHRGAWGASFLPYNRSNLTELARDLLEQAKDMHASRNE